MKCFGVGALYDLGHFPIEPDSRLLEQWRERFYCFMRRGLLAATSAEAGTGMAKYLS